MSEQINKSVFHCKTKNGDSFALEILSSGAHFAVLPKEPPFDEGVIDFFTTGLRTTTVLVAINKLKAGERYNPPNKIEGPIALLSNTLWVDNKELNFKFVPEHSPDKSFTCALTKENTQCALEVISDYIEGKITGPFPEHSLMVESIMDAMGNHTERPDPSSKKSKTGRNDPCPCGSGKKYKKCCLRKPLQQEDSGSIKAFEHIRDEYTQALIIEAKKNPVALTNPLYWGDLGQALGTIQEYKLSLKCFNESLTLNPTDFGIIANKAATLGFLNRNSEALKLFEEVPDGKYRKSIMLGHLHEKMGSFAAAKPLFEKAINEEPDFPLPYLNLISLLVDEAGYSHPDLDYLMRRATEAVPKDPSIATMYCRYLHANGRIEELAEAEWINSIKTSGDISIVGRNSKDTRRITEAQLFHKAALAFYEDSSDRLEEAVEILSSSPKEWHLCDTASFLTAASVRMGRADLTKQCYSRICRNCKARPIKNFPSVEDTIIGQAWMQAGDFNKAVQLFKVAYNQDPNCTHLLNSYYWSLDEVGKTNEAINLAEKLRETHPKEVNLNYNLGFMCSKDSAYGRARFYYEAELEISPKHPLAQEHLIVTCLLEKDLNSANEHFDKWQKNVSFILEDENKIHESDDSNAYDVFLGKRHAVTELIDYAKDNIKSPTYLQDLIDKNESADIFIGSTVGVSPRVFSCSDLIDAWQNQGQPHAKDVLFNMKLEQSGDYSMLALSLKEEIPHINDLNAGSKIALLEAEKRFREERSGDTSLFIVGYCKSFESQLKVSVFDEYRRVCHDLFDLKEEIAKASASNALKQTIPFLKYLNRPLGEESHIELGGMARAIKLSCGKTAKRSEIMAMLRSFIENDLQIKGLCESGPINDSEKLAEVWRNPAAHSEIFGQDALLEVRKTVFKMINLIVK